MMAITRLTLKEAVRKKVLVITLLLTTGFLVLYGVGAHFAVSSARAEAGSLAAVAAVEVLPHSFLVLGLFFGTFITGFFAIASAVGTISLELESGILQAVAPRPVRRSSIVLGKSLGFGIIVAVYSALFYLAIIGTTAAATGARVPPQAGVLALYVLHPLVLLSVTMLGTTGLTTIANGIMTFMLYALSVMGGTLEQIGHLLANEALINAGIVSSLIMPADSLYRKMAGLTMRGVNLGLVDDFLGPFGSMAEPSVWMLFYTAGYMVFFLAMAVRAFSKRDIG